MSIAISFILHPSKILRFLAIAFSILLVLVAIYVGCFGVIPFPLRVALVLLCLVGSIHNLITHFTASQRHWHIAVGGQGDFRCAIIDSHGCAVNSSSSSSLSYRLAPGSILWSKILILRLQGQNDDNMLNLMVLSDAVSDDEFRCLSIACRWINSHTTSAIRK